MIIHAWRTIGKPVQNAAAIFIIVSAKQGDGILRAQQYRGYIVIDWSEQHRINRKGCLEKDIY
ncbi:hypothetical protein AA105894_1321 [Asaia spathodeae NBRC 105894]|nr:hypothetical protein AA105894_1321 [Asaia spathodeae NBRC 105894]